MALSCSDFNEWKYTSFSKIFCNTLRFLGSVSLAKVAAA